MSYTVSPIRKWDRDIPIDTQQTRKAGKYSSYHEFNASIDAAPRRTLNQASQHVELPSLRANNNVSTLRRNPPSYGTNNYSVGSSANSMNARAQLQLDSENANMRTSQLYNSTAYQQQGQGRTGGGGGGGVVPRRGRRQKREGMTIESSEEKEDRIVATNTSTSSSSAAGLSTSFPKLGAASLNTSTATAISVMNTAAGLHTYGDAKYALPKSTTLLSPSARESITLNSNTTNISKDITVEEGQTASASSIRGLKPGNPNWINQDSYFIVENFEGRNINFYCVLDGHGEHGHHVSRRCKEVLPQFIKTANLDMKRTFFLMQSDLHTCSGFDANCSGATCILVCLQNHRLLISNCGDSRAILCTRINGMLQAHALSIDHKPDRPEERKRIIASGGRLGCRQVIVNDHGMAIPTGPCRVWYTYRGDSMGLAMSRSLGDLVVHNVGVSAEPEIIEHNVEVNDEFVILATDGIWDVVDNNQACQLVSSIASKSPQWSTQEAASLLTKFARNRWTKLSLTADDITCIVVKLR